MLRQFISTFIPQSEEKINLSELRYRRLFETAQDGILILEANTGQIIDVNPFFEERLGYSKLELLGKKLWQIDIFKNIMDSEYTFSKLQTDQNIHHENLLLKTKDKHDINVEFNSNIYMVDRQEIVQCNMRDITDRVRTEELAKLRGKELEQLSKSQDETKMAMLNVMEDLEEAKIMIEAEKAKDEAMFASIGEGLIAVDNARKIVTINRAAEDILCWKAKDLIGKIITSLPLEDQDGNRIPLEKRPTYLALSTGKPTNVVYFFVKKDKTRLPLAINVTPITVGEKIIGSIETIRDVTRETEIDKAKSEFVSLASHQLRTPLGITKWYLEAIQNEDYLSKSPTVIRKYFDEINKSNERVLSLVRDLLSVSRIEQGRVKDVPSQTDLILTIQGIIDQMQILAHKKKIILHLTIKNEKIAPIKIDPIRFHEVIENLIANAIEYTTGPGSVDIIVKEDNNSLFIDVIDTGIGIPIKDQKRLFTKFFRSEKAIGHNPEGSGLGLYLVKSYIEGWGGKVSVKSQEQKGSVFSISLPMKVEGGNK